MKNHEVSEKVEYDIFFPGRNNVLSALLRDYLDNLDDSYRIIESRFNNITNCPIYLKGVQEDSTVSFNICPKIQKLFKSPKNSHILS